MGLVSRAGVVPLNLAADKVKRGDPQASQRLQDASAEAEEATLNSTITARELKEWQDAGKDLFLVDVREPAEYEINRIPGSTLITKGDILSGEALSRFPQDRQIVLHCKSGVRSAEALAALKAAGFKDAVHVQGGILSWINTVDPSLPSY